MNGVRVRLVSFVVAAAAALVLSGCAGGGASPTPTPTPSPTSTPTPTASPTPAPTPTETSSAILPTDCTALGTDATRSQTVGDMTLQSDGVGFVRPAPDAATLALGCDWIVGDTTGLLLLISTADPAAVTTAVEALPDAEGYTCQVSDDFGAEFCEKPGDSADTEELIVARDNVWIYMSTSNRNGRAFLSEIVQGIFG